jgi:hypothetical protein
MKRALKSQHATKRSDRLEIQALKKEVQAMRKEIRSLPKLIVKCTDHLGKQIWEAA